MVLVVMEIVPDAVGLFFNEIIILDEPDDKPVNFEKITSAEEPLGGLVN